MLELEIITGPNEFDSIVQSLGEYSTPEVVIVGEDSDADEPTALDAEIQLAERAILAVAQYDEDQQVGNGYESQKENSTTTTPTDNEPDVLHVASTGSGNKPPIDLPPPTLQGSPDYEEGAGRNLEQSGAEKEATTQHTLEADQILYGPIEIRGKIFGRDVGIRVEGEHYVAPQDYVPANVSTPKVQPLIYEEMAAQKPQTEQAELESSDVPSLPQPEHVAPNETIDAWALQKAENLRRMQEATRLLREPSGDQQDGGTAIEFMLEPLPRVEDPESIRYWGQRKAVYEKLVSDAEADPSTDPRLLDNLRSSVEMAEMEAEAARTQGKRYFGLPSRNSPSQQIYVTREALDPPFEPLYLDEEDEDKR